MLRFLCRSRTWLWLIPLLAALMAGCGSPAGTAAVLTLGAVGGGAGAVAAQTHSWLDVDVEVFADSASCGPQYFKMDTPTTISRQLRIGQDPVLYPTAQNIAAAHAALRVAMLPVKKAEAELRESIKQIDQAVKEVPDGSLEKTYAPVRADFDALRKERVLNAWEAFDGTCREAEADGCIVKQLVPLREQLRALRQELAAAAAYKVSSSFIACLKSQVKAAVLEELIPIINRARTAEGAEAERIRAEAQQLRTLVQGVLDEMRLVVDDRRADTDARVAAVLEPLRLALQKDSFLAAMEEVEAQPPEKALTLGKTLRRFGIFLSVAELRDLGSAGQIAGALEVAFAPAAFAGGCTRAYEFTYGGITSGVNLGPLRDEVLQMLLTGRVMDVITDAQNIPCWRSLNYARVHCGGGNHDVIVYLENSVTPVIKSSEFDPSRFIKANAVLYHQAFAAAAAAFGMPGAGAAAGATAPFNVLALSARRKAAEQDAAKVNKAILAALKAVIDEEGKAMADSGQQAEPKPKPEGDKKEDPAGKPKPDGEKKEDPTAKPKPNADKKEDPAAKPKPDGEKKEDPAGKPKPDGDKKEDPTAKPKPDGDKKEEPKWKDAATGEAASKRAQATLKGAAEALERAAANP